MAGRLHAVGKYDKVTIAWLSVHVPAGFCLEQSHGPGFYSALLFCNDNPVNLGTCVARLVDPVKVKAKGNSRSGMPRWQLDHSSAGLRS